MNVAELEAPSTNPVQTAHRLLAERRTQLRFPCDLRATCRTGGGKTGLAWLAKVHNISRKGIGLVVGRHFAAKVVLNLQIGDRVRQVKVIHAYSLGPAGWFVGCLFALPLSVDELDGLLR